jgi:uncharacterized protein involved in copper resistance
MCQARHPQSQNPARHLADKMGYPPQNLPWTDKFCHFVMFETPNALPQPKHLRSRVMRSRARRLGAEHSKIRVHRCQSVAASSLPFPPFALSHPPLFPIHQFSLFNLHFAICNSPPPDTPLSW